MRSAATSAFVLLRRVYASENGFWDPTGNGRHAHRIPSTFTDAEHELLADHDLVPNTFVELGHDETIRTLRDVARTIEVQAAANAFVASFTSADVSWLPVLPALALGLAMPEHSLDPMNGGSCKVCFYSPHAVDRTITRYFQHRQGAPWGASAPLQAVMTLELATARLAGEWPKPLPHDIWAFHQLLDCVTALPPASRYSKARTAVRNLGLLQANTVTRCESLLEALSFIGILANADHPGLFTRFTTAVKRDRRPNVRVEVPAPLAWWSAADGVNAEIVQQLFGHLQRPATQPESLVAPPTKRVGTRASQVRKEVLAGDVYAVRFREDLWGAVYCHEALDDKRGIPRGRVEFLDFVAESAPTAESLEHVGFRDRANGERWQCWCRSLTNTSWVKRVATEFRAPPHDQPTPDRIPYNAASELKFLATWNFPDKWSD
jgi:hypothetical protein